MSELVKKLREGDRWDYSSGDLLSSASIMDEAADRIEHLERVLAQAKHAMQANHNCLTTDRPDFPISPETSWTTDFSKELAAIDEALK